MCRNKQAFTLAEMIIAAVIALVVIGLFVGILVPALRNTGSRSTRAELGQAAAVAMIKVGSVLRSSVAPAIRVYTYGLAVTPLGDLSPDGRQQYLGNLTVVSFEKTERILALGEWSPASPDPNTWIQAPDDFNTLLPLKNRKQVTANVEDFQVFWLDGTGVPTSAGPPNSPLTVRLVLERKVTTDDPERMEMETSVCLRNARQ